MRIAGWSIREDRLIPYRADKKRSTVQEWVIHLQGSVCKSLTNQRRLVLVTPKLINMPSKSMNDTSRTTETTETLKQSVPIISTNLTCSLEDSLAKVFQSLESAEGSMTLAGRSSLKLREYCTINNLPDSYWKTLKDCFLTTTDSLSKQSSPRLMNWGTTSNGKCLTARITESPRTGSACSLSDILEEHPDPKYFLSESVTQSILSRMHKGTTLHTPSSAAISTEEATFRTQN